MDNRKLTGTIAVLAATAAAALFSGTAQAAMIDDDDVRQTSTGFDLGNGGFALGEQPGSADLDWFYDGGEVHARLTGTPHLNNVTGDCARIRLDYYNAASTTLATEYGGRVCANDNAHHEWTVDLDEYEDADVAKLKVTLEKQTASGWSTAAYSFHYTNPPEDNVKISTVGVDLGDQSFIGTAPVGSAKMNRQLSGGESHT
jgi:hypothetical protein